MCGIAGFISPAGEKDHGPLKGMSDMLEHRGPDGFGYLLHSVSGGMRVWHNQEIFGFDKEPSLVGFAHRRLSVIDLTTDSLQPMVDGEEKRVSVVYNGEIYNYLELRDELERLGYVFRTESDTEVLIKAYLAWGPDCLERLNGMWAFALLDVPLRRVILSRDRFGIKPLYFTVRNHTLYFASEIKGLLAHPEVPCNPDEKTVSHFLLRGLVDDTGETFFKGIQSFPAAHWAEISLDDPSLSIQPKAYWSIPNNRFQGTELEAVERFRELFFDALRIHSRSDVPVGTCLSGGLDSSSIVCSSEILRSKNEIPRYTHTAFGYCSEDEAFSEKHYMQAVVDATGVRMHYVEPTTGDFISFLPTILRSQDEPFGSASIAVQWFVFQRAREEGMTVMLDGQGADEILAGYHYYFNTLVSYLLRRLRIGHFLAIRSAYEREIGSFPLSFRSVIGRMTPRPLERIALAARRLMSSQGLINPVSKVMRPDLLEKHRGHSSDGSRLPTTLSQALERDVQVYSLPALLRYEDRNSMAHSIESRVPFLDYRLVDFAFTLPDEWKIRCVSTKHILRSAMDGILPDIVRKRKDKLGFKAAPNLTFDFAKKHYTSLVDNMTDLEKRWFEPEEVDQMLQKGDQSIEAEFLLWRLVNTKLWVRQFWG